MFLILDTETNGLGTRSGSRFGRPRTAPRLLELAYILASDDGRPQQVYATLIVPEGFRVSSAARDVHGITTEEATLKGVPVREALESVLHAAERARVIVAHNAHFDCSVILGEMERCNLSPRSLFQPWYCTMRGSASVCKGRIAGPWPTLRDLHRTLFGVEPLVCHRAGADAEACARCFFEMRRRRQLDRSGLIWVHSSGGLPPF